MYKEATQLKLRFATTVGQVSLEQLWDLSLSQLSAAIKAVKKLLAKNDDDELSFLEETKIVDTENQLNQLRFNILKEIYLERKKEVESIRNAAEVKAHNAKIDALIAEKQEADLRGMSIEELTKLRK